MKPQDRALLTAALLHDIGKPYTQSKLNAKGEDNGECHYYQHHCVGAYESMLYTKNMGYSDDEIIRVANLIYYHMCPYMAWKASNKARERDRKSLGEEMYNDILLLHEADVCAH